MKQENNDDDKRITRIHIDGNTSLARDYFTEQCTRACALYNSANFVQRNTMTALVKAPGMRSSNENDVLDRLDAAWPEYRTIMIRSLVKKIAKNRGEGKNSDTDIKRLQDVYKASSLYSPGKWLLGYNALDALFKLEKNEHYKQLHSHVAQNVLKELAQAYSTFIGNIADYRQNPDKYKGRPKLPGYMRPGGLRTIVFSAGDCKVEEVITDEVRGTREKCLVFPKTRKKHFVPVGDLFEVGDKVGEVRVKPVGSGFEVHIVRDVEYPDPIEDNGVYAGGDLGLENLITISSNEEGIRPLIVDGREIKSINQYFNKKIAETKSELPQGVRTSEKIQGLYDKRANQLRTSLGFAARLCAVYLSMIGASKFIVGKNDGWKQNLKLGKKTTQSFVYVPYEYFLGCLERRCRELGIDFRAREESYTSKASLADKDEIPVWNGNEKHRPHDAEFSGKRVKRGLYRDSRGRLFNADVNASGNILRKEIPDAFSKVVDFKYLMNPCRVKLGVFSGGGMSLKSVLAKVGADTGGERLKQK